MFEPHAHACHELIVPLRGRVRADLPRCRVEAGPGDLLWYPQGMEHREQVVGPGSGDWHYLLIAWEGGRDWPQFFSDRDGRIRLLSGMIADLQGDPTHAAENLRQALAAAIIAGLSGLCAGDSGSRTDGMVDTVGQWIQSHLAHPITLSRLAQVAGLSRAHFARAYHARTGSTPMTALRDARLAAARELLLTTDLPLREIAPRVGLNSEYFLSRWLSRRFGLGARALRRGRRRIGTT